MKQLLKWNFFLYAVSGMFMTGLIQAKRAVALDLSAPFLLETAQVLPQNVGNPRFVNLFMSVDSKFNGSGSIEPLGNRLNRVITWSDVIQVQESAVEKGAIRSSLRDIQLSESDSPGATSGQVNTYVNVKAPALAMGITDRFTLAVAIPIYDISVSADTGFVKSENGQAWTEKLCRLSVDECNKAARKLNNSVNEKLTEYRYDPIQSRKISGIGDVQLIGKYLVHQDQTNTWAVKSNFVIPTGTPPDVNKALDVPTGDGRFQLGATMIYDRSLPYDFRWNAFGGMTALMPNSMEKRIPLAIDDPISPDKEELTRNLGAVVSSGTSLVHVFPSIGLMAGAGYSFQFLAKSRYSGGKLSDRDRYLFLEDLSPSQVMHTAILTTGFSTVEWYQKKKFVYPLQANLTFSRPFLGRNVASSHLLAGEVVLFF
jgi:hypothetical protein